MLASADQRPGIVPEPHQCLMPRGFAATGTSVKRPKNSLNAPQHHHHHHHHVQVGEHNQRRLTLALLLTATFLLFEVAGAWWFNSLALLADAAHMFTDSAALGIALLATRWASRPADRRRTFGYHRFEILAAMLNATLLLIAAGYIFVEAWQRLRAPEPVQSNGLLLLAIGGLIVNLIALRLLSGGRHDNLSIKGAYMEVLSDALGSVGIIIGALVIRYTGWNWVDPLIAVAIALWVLPRAWLLLRESTNILLEGAPHDLEVEQIEQEILATPGVLSLHDLHVWSLATQRNSLAVHVVHEQATAPAQLTADLCERLAKRFGLHHTTVQCETRPCPQSLHGCAITAVGANAGLGVKNSEPHAHHHH